MDLSIDAIIFSMLKTMRGVGLEATITSTSGCNVLNQWNSIVLYKLSMTYFVRILYAQLEAKYLCSNVNDIWEGIMVMIN